MQIATPGHIFRHFGHTRCELCVTPLGACSADPKGQEICTKSFMLCRKAAFLWRGGADVGRCLFCALRAYVDLTRPVLRGRCLQYAGKHDILRINCLAIPKDDMRLSSIHVQFQSLPWLLPRGQGWGDMRSERQQGARLPSVHRRPPQRHPTYRMRVSVYHFAGNSAL